MQECPKNFLYSHRHVWVELPVNGDEGIVRVGLTHYYLEELGEILAIDTPLVGETIEIDQEFIHLHIADGIEEMPSPLSGHVHEVNREVLDRPDLVHLKPYEHWIVELEYDDPDEFEILVDALRYVRYVESF